MPRYLSTNGDEFTIQAEDRGYGGKLTEVFKASKDGVVTVAGQTISSSGVIGATGAVTATTINASGLVAAAAAVTVGTTLGVTGATTLSGGVAVTGSATVGGKTVATGSNYSIVQAGKNGAGALTLTGALQGDTVVAIANLTAPGDLQSSFEATITVAGQIQQSAATDLSAKQVLFILHHL
jgi:hypothetical protein